MSIPDPDFLLILDPGSKNLNKREGWKKIWCHTFFCRHKFHNIVNYFIIEMLKKKNWPSLQRVIDLFSFYPKICDQALKNMGLGSGSMGQKGTGHRIRNTDSVTSYCDTVLQWKYTGPRYRTTDLAWSVGTYCYGTVVQQTAVPFQNYGQKEF